MAGLGGNINIGYHGSPFYQDILGQGFKGGTGQSSQIFGRSLPSWGGSGGTYTTGNPGAALRYGAPIEVAQSARNFTLPFGGGIDRSGISFGSETRLRPDQATKGMNLMQKLRSGIYANSPMAQRLLSTGTTGGMGGASRFGLGALRLAGLTNPVGAAAAATYAAPKLIDALTKRDADATETSMFGLNIDDLEKRAAEYDYTGEGKMLGSTLNDWGFPSGVVPGEEIQETETVTDPDWDRHMRMINSESAEEEGIFAPNKWQQFLSKYTRQPYRGAQRHTRDFTPAQLNRLNALGGWYSEPARQQRRDRRSVDTLLARKAAAEAGTGAFTQHAQQKLNQLTLGSRPGHYDRPGGDSTPRGTDTPASGPGGWGPGAAQGGYMRSQYNKGGRVGILSVF